MLAWLNCIFSHWRIYADPSGLLDMALFASDGECATPCMEPNDSKILESILLVIELSEKAKTPATQFEIAKTIFLADYRHLQTYGRPVTFDNFHAMKFGPVPSRTYDMLKPNFDWGALSLARAPWKVRSIDSNARAYVHPSRSANRRRLSESDIDEIERAFRDVKAMGFKQTSDETHKLEAYKQAWAARGTSLAKQMDLRLLLPEFDDEMIDDLVRASRFAA